MTRRLITTGLLLGGLALAAAACGTSDPQVQARQTGDTTATTAAPTTTSAPPSATTAAASDPTAPPAATVPPQPPCTAEALTAAYTAKFGSPDGSITPQKCVGGWATSSLVKGYSPPTFALYRADGDHWVALNRSSGKLCVGQGVPADVAPQIGCDT